MTTGLEDAKVIDLEEWLTLNTAASTTKLLKGQTPNTENTWVDEKPGSVISANGYLKVGTLPSGNPPTFCLNYFKTSTGTELFVVSDNATVWTTLDFQTFTSIITGLSNSFQLRGAVIRNKLWLTNGSDAVRTFDGATVVVLDGTAGTPTVPRGRYIAYYDERVWLYHVSSNRSAVNFSALTSAAGAIIDPDNAAAWPVENQIQISEGDGDFGTGLLLYRGYLHAFKQYSIYRIVGYDEYTYTRVKTRSSVGTRFNESIQILDTQVHFIGTDGLYVFDGENSERISDIIDPSAAAQTSFGFNQLQQPNTNNFFWETSVTADWNLGTVPQNVTVNDSIELKSRDDIETDFSSGATLTNIDYSTASGSIKLALTTAGRSNLNAASGKTGVLNPAAGFGIVGLSDFLTDGNLTNAAGFSAPASRGINGAFGVTGISLSLNLTTIVLKGLICGAGSYAEFSTNVDLTPSSVSGAGAVLAGRRVTFPAVTTPTDYTITFPSFIANGGISVNVIQPSAGTGIGTTVLTVTEIQVFTAAYNVTGKFTSRTLDLSEAPHSLGTFSATVTTPSGSSLTYFTQSSADNISWDAEVACTNGGSIGSTVRRYLRWGANFVSDGNDTPVIDAAYLPAQYISAVHNTAGGIFAWGPLEAGDTNYAGQVIQFYYRSGTTSPNCLAATWRLIVPGGVISDVVANAFVQFKIEISGGDATHLPLIPSVTINWVVGTGTQPQTLQNVASIVWKNRYWLAAAGPSATANNAIIIRGKKTFNYPWQLKDWSILSFTRFHDGLYGGSSTDGSLYRLDVGYSKNGSAMDSFFETGDFVAGGFEINLVEVLVEVERLGPYNLSVGVSIDQGNTWTEKSVDLTTSNFANDYIKLLNFDIKGTRLRFRVRTNAADQPFQVHRLIGYYKQSMARGSLS